MERKIIAENFNKLKALGYGFSIMEGGYVSPDNSTIVIETRAPYNRCVRQYQPNRDDDFCRCVAELDRLGFLEPVPTGDVLGSESTSTTTSPLYILTNTNISVCGGNTAKYHTKVLGTSFHKENLCRTMLDWLKSRLSYITVNRMETAAASMAWIDTVMASMRGGRPVNLGDGLTLSPIMKGPNLLGVSFQKTRSISGFPDIVEIETCHISVCKDFSVDNATERRQGDFPFDDNEGTRKEAIMENCEYTITAKSGAISIDQLKKMLLARFGMKDIEITVHRPLNPYVFPNKKVPGLLKACKDEIVHWEGIDNISGVIDVCDTDNVRELAGKICAVLRDEMSMDKAVQYTKELISAGCNRATPNDAVSYIQLPKGAGKTPGQFRYWRSGAGSESDKRIVTYTMADNIPENKPSDRMEWAQPIPDVPLFLREKSDGNIEGIRICQGIDGKFGVAHGIVRFTGDFFSGYRRAIAELTFQKEEYLETCLLPERYDQFDSAEKRMYELMGKKHGA